jgi:hypothetical protein
VGEAPEDGEEPTAGGCVVEEAGRREAGGGGRRDREVNLLDTRRKKGNRSRVRALGWPFEQCNSVNFVN